MTDRELSTFLVQVKGPALSVLIALFGLGGRPAGRDDLVVLTGYSAGSVAAGLERLEFLGLAMRTGRYSGYVLTSQARQLPLFEQDQALETDDEVVDADATPVSEVQKITFGSSRCLSLSRSEDVSVSADSETPPRESEVQKSDLELDGDGEEAIALLVETGCPERTRNSKGARDCVEAAIEGGWTCADALEAVEGWLAYAASPAGKWISHAGFLAGSRVARRQWPPAQAEDRDGQVLAAIAAAEARVMQR